jgi:hypothetical protein
MAWINALDVAGAELVARDPVDPNTWFDPVALYPGYISVTAGVVTVLQFATDVLATPPPPVILEFGVRFPVGFTAANSRVSATNGAQLTPPQDGSTIQLLGTLVAEGGADIATADMSASLSVVIETDITSPTAVGEIVDNAASVILAARAVVTPP